MLAHALHGYSLGLQPELVHTFEAGVELTVVAPLVHGSKPGYDYMAAEEEASEDMAAEEEASEDMAAEDEASEVPAFDMESWAFAVVAGSHLNQKRLGRRWLVQVRRSVRM